MIRIINGLALIIIGFCITAYMIYVYGKWPGLFMGIFVSMCVIVFFSVAIELIKKIRDKYFW